MLQQLSSWLGLSKPKPEIVICGPLAVVRMQPHIAQHFAEIPYLGQRNYHGGFPLPCAPLSRLYVHEAPCC